MRYFLLFTLLLPVLACGAQSQVYIPDSSFWSTGNLVVRYGQNADDQGNATLLQPNGMIVAAGATSQRNDSQGNPIYDMAICRLRTDGFLDGSFDTAGYKHIEISPQGSKAIKLLRDDLGRIIVLGNIKNQIDNHVFILRLLYNGDIDTTFGSQGKTIVELAPNTYNFITNAALQPDGKIVFCGWSSKNMSPDTVKCYISRLRSNGVLDTSFNHTGIWRDNFPVVLFNELFCISIQNDGKILSSGFTGFDVGTLIRFNNDGSFDTTFNHSGVVTPTQFRSFYGHFTGMKIFRDSSIIVSHFGSKFDTNTSQWLRGFCISKISKYGNVDTLFGNNGIGMIYSDNLNISYIKSSLLEEQPDGKILLAGIWGYSLSSAPFVARFNPNGLPDSTFGVNGLEINTGSGPLNDAKLTPDGKIVSATSFFNGLNYRFGVTRLRLYTVYAGVAEPQSPEQSIGRAVVSPNPVPAGAAAGLQYELPEEANIRVALYDIQGRELAQLQSVHRTAGKHEDEITMPSGLAAGMYFVTIATDTGKMVSVKVIIE